MTRLRFGRRLPEGLLPGDPPPRPPRAVVFWHPCPSIGVGSGRLASRWPDDRRQENVGVRGRHDSRSQGVWVLQLLGPFSVCRDKGMRYW